MGRLEEAPGWLEPGWEEPGWDEPGWEGPGTAPVTKQANKKRIIPGLEC